MTGTDERSAPDARREDAETATSANGLAPRPVRADAKRNLDGLLQAAMEVFAVSGVDAPVREIASKAGVGVGTLYRHFPQRSDLIKAALRREIDACADAAPVLSKAHAPADALKLWMQRFVDFLAAKRGLADALHSGDPAYAALPQYFDQRLRPALDALLDAAITAGEIDPSVSGSDLIQATARLTSGASADTACQAKRMVGLLVDGMRYGANG